MGELRNAKQLVYEALKSSEKARNSDNHLYFLICKAILAAQQIDINNISFATALLHRKEYGLPAFETCRRARQRLQATHPEFAASEKVAAVRAIREESFREFAKNG